MTGKLEIQWGWKWRKELTEIRNLCKDSPKLTISEKTIRSQQKIEENVSRIIWYYVSFVAKTHTAKYDSCLWKETVSELRKKNVIKKEQPNWTGFSRIFDETNFFGISLLFHKYKLCLCFKMIFSEKAMLNLRHPACCQVFKTMGILDMHSCYD